MTINYGDLFDQKDYFLEKYNQRDAFSGEPSIGLFIYNEFIHNESTGFAKTLLLECYYRLNRTKYKESLQNKFEIKVEFFESNKNK
jgi:hypothetical protein